MLRRELLKLHEDVPDLSLITYRLFKPAKLLGTQGHRDSLRSDPSGPLIPRAALAGFVSFD